MFHKCAVSHLRLGKEPVENIRKGEALDWTDLQSVTFKAGQSKAAYRRGG